MSSDLAAKKKRVYLVFPDEDGLRSAKAMAAKAGKTFSDWVLRLVQAEVAQHYKHEMGLAGGYAPAEFYERTKKRKKGGVK